MSIAHYFTLFRILIIPLFPLLYFEHHWFGISAKLLPFALMFILAICEFTDLFDGFIARKKNQVTDLGKVLDPMADSIMRITVLFTFTQGSVSLPLLLVFEFMYRDLFISTLRTLCALKGFTLAARPSGKVKAILQATVAFIILFLMVPYEHGYISIQALQQASITSVLIVAIYTVISAIDYIYANRSYIKRAIGVT